MKKTVSVFATMCILAIGTINSTAQTNNIEKIKKMETVNSSKEVVQGFFNAFGKGDLNSIINSFHDSCKVTAVRNTNRDGDQIYGSYQGVEGVKNSYLIWEQLLIRRCFRLKTLSANAM